MQVTIYTDGACDIHADNQPGGWAAILRATDDSGKLLKETVISGGAENTTNNQMELTAVIEGLKLLNCASALVIFSDSRYVIDIAKKKKKAVKNRSLWNEFSEAAASHFIEWEYVAGHSGDELNERCDRLAVEEKNKRAKDSTSPGEEPIALKNGVAGIFLSTRYAAKDRTTSWAAIIKLGDSERQLSGRLETTSELEGALIAGIKSLESLPSNQNVTLFTAQEYLSKGMNQWLPNWVKKGWKTRNGAPVKYRSHWERLRQLTDERQVEFRFVKSREDIPHFQRGKELAAEVLTPV